MSGLLTRFGALLVELGLVTSAQVEEGLALQELTGHRLGEALLSLGYLTRGQLQRSLAEALRRGAEIPLDKPPLGEILIGLKYLDPRTLDTVLEKQLVDGRRLGELLVEAGAVTEQQVYEALGLQQRMAAAPGPAPVTGEHAVVSAPRGIKVMVVDDSKLACDLVAEGLLAHGYEAFTFQDPNEAITQVETVRPDIVLTDLDMPGMDGSELCRRVKEGPRGSVPVIILTANDAAGQRVGGLRAGADDYVNKGVSMDELSARIEGILRRTRETERVRRLFARYTSDAVVAEILKAGEVVLTGEKREVTVLFADIRNFTSLAESLPPEQVMALLNDVLGRLADAVLAYGGTLDKFLGDGLMAVFGAPVKRDDDASRALSAAKEMLASMGRRGVAPQMDLGIGINSGPVVAGSLGNQRRTEYTCIGDAVNVAARLCALAGPSEILCGELTAARAGPLHRFEALAPVRLKGKSQAVPVFRARRDDEKER
ncbi:MAG: response regulator [Myxococcaceae bacterium]|nr:response regulator [Myxococcaceae bacterium]